MGLSGDDMLAKAIIGALAGGLTVMVAQLVLLGVAVCAGALRRRWYVWSWRWRYWWLDTPGGQRARFGTLLVGLMACVVDVLWMLYLAAAPRAPGAPATAIADWIIYLIILIISALISYAMRPKPENAKPQQVESPTTEDGTPVRDYFGTCWIEHDERFLLAWKIVGRDPIRSKGGK